LLTGCPFAEDGLRLGLVESQGLLRSYWLHVPEDDSADARPLVIALHGFTEDGRVMAESTGFNAISDREGFIVAYPNGLMRRFSAFPDEPLDDSLFVRDVINAIKSQYNIESTRVYVTGASNGAFLTYLLACRAGDVIAAAAPVMASMPRDIADQWTPVRPVPILIIHGTADPIIPYDAAEVFAGPGNTYAALPVPETVQYWVAANNAYTTATETALPDLDPDDDTLTVLYTYPATPDGADVLFYEVQGGGHTWPGGSVSYPPFVVGTTAQDFDASEAIWEFFSRHSLAE